MLEEKLAKLREKIDEVNKEREERITKSKKMLAQAQKGLNILNEIARIPEIEEYTHYRDVYMAKGGFGSYDIVIHHREEEKAQPARIYYCFTVLDTRCREASDYKLLEEGKIKEFINKYFFHDGDKDKFKIAEVLCRVNEIGKKEMLERILKELLPFEKY